MLEGQAIRPTYYLERIMGGLAINGSKDREIEKEIHSNKARSPAFS
jgi:hypothetical protein